MGVLVWGDNSFQQCETPALQLDAKFVQLAIGNDHVIAIQSDGQPIAWGSNVYGQAQSLPPGAGANYVRLSASDHNLALQSDGTLRAWGRNDFGQCEVPILPRGVQWTGIAVGALHSVGLTSNGLVYCWGDDSAFQCDVRKPTLGRTYIAVAAGGNHTVALRSDGQVVCWGDNTRGQCEPPLAPEVRYVAISAGLGHTLALTDQGRVVAWGAVDGAPVVVPPMPLGHRVVQIAAGAQHDLALLDDGSIRCWGNNESGQIMPPMKLANFEAVRVSAGGRNSAVLFQAYAPDIVPICLGDGSFEPCPCRNDSEAGGLAGCLNSGGSAGKLTAIGSPRILGDGLKLQIQGLPAGIALILQGVTSPYGGSGLQARFGHAQGNGLMCLEDPMRRLGVVYTHGGISNFPSGQGPLSQLGGILEPQHVSYQVWYHDARSLCGSDSSNFTNALRVGWTL
ncbi:MAG: hypothetical protein IPJ19_01325 [Planctomycetes bacterium]|nr:hypothetical protein [Planctomycetota bacterium]